MNSSYPTLVRPVFIIAAPRSGSSLLFETLARTTPLWTLAGEAHREFDDVPGWHPRDRGYDSNRLTAADLKPGDRERLLQAFSQRLQHSDGLPWRSLAHQARPGTLRLLEKTPKNCLRVPLLRALFPDSRFIFLWREPCGNVSSILEAWRSGRLINHRKLPGWSGPPWSLLLPPGWRELNGLPLVKVAAFQWRSANQFALDDLSALPREDWCALNYDELLSAPHATVRRLCDFMDVPCKAEGLPAPEAGLPLSQHTLTAPAPGKWRSNEEAIRSVLPELEDGWARLRRLQLAATVVDERQPGDPCSIPNRPQP